MREAVCSLIGREWYKNNIVLLVINFKFLLLRGLENISYHNSHQIKFMNKTQSRTKLYSAEVYNTFLIVNKFTEQISLCTTMH